MKHYVVLYRESAHVAADPPLAFACQADDADHAEEQCIDAEGEDAQIVWVWEGASADDAYGDYWNGHKP